ncbi:hypothetical protein C8R47DRAFT_1162318 [Mycena vitilis]|nr:hypothetical protein C8R47DRAFT_1162318 [Mycena vitilis]
MSNSHLASIWSSYVQSPPGVPTLRDYSAALLSHPLSSSQLIPAPGGSALPPQLTEALTSALPAVEALTRAAAGRCCLPTDELSCTSELRLIRTHRTLGRIALTWVLILQRLGSHMQELELLCAPSDVPRVRHPSTIPQIVDSLCPALRAALPRSVFDLFHIPIVPSPSDSAPRTEVRSRQASRVPEEVFGNGTTRRAITCVHPRSGFPITDASNEAPRKEVHSRETSRTVEEFLDSGATRRAIALDDKPREKRSVPSCAGSTGTHHQNLQNLDRRSHPHERDSPAPFSTFWPDPYPLGTFISSFSWTAVGRRTGDGRGKESEPGILTRSNEIRQLEPVGSANSLGSPQIPVKGFPNTTLPNFWTFEERA